MTSALASLIGADGAQEWRGALSSARDASFARERDIRTALDEATAAVQAQRQGQVNLPMLMWAAGMGMPTRAGSFSESLSQGLQQAGPAIAQQRNEEQQQQGMLQKLRMAGIDAGHSGAMERMQLANAPFDVLSKVGPLALQQQKLAMEVAQRERERRAFLEAQGGAGGQPPAGAPMPPPTVGGMGMDLKPPGGAPAMAPPARVPLPGMSPGFGPDGAAPPVGLPPVGGIPPMPTIAPPADIVTPAPVPAPAGGAAPLSRLQSADEFDRLAQVYGRNGDYKTAREYQEKAIAARAAEAKALAEADAAAKKDVIAGTDNMRKELGGHPQVRSYQKVVPIFDAMIGYSKTDSKAADLGLIYSLASILDPDSVVREGETIMVKRTGGLDDQVLGWINQVNGGSQFTPGQRASIMQVAAGRVGALRSGADEIAKPFIDIAQRRGWDIKDVLPAIPAVPKYEPTDISREARPSTSGPTVPQNHVEHLRANPGTRDDFDRKYGRGAADRYLGGR